MRKNKYFFDFFDFFIKFSSFFGHPLHILGGIPGMRRQNALYIEGCRPKMLEKIRNAFLSSPKKYFLLELRKILGYSFDVKNYYLSIYDVFRAF